MCFTDPMILANAMIFHDNMMQQMNNTLWPNDYTLPSFYQGLKFDRQEIYYENVASEYTIPTPIKDFINNPIIMEDALYQREYMKMVMGRYDEALLVSIFFQSPNISQIPQIKTIISERIKEFKQDNDEILLVISGQRDKQFDNSLLKSFHLPYKIIQNTIVMKYS